MKTLKAYWKIKPTIEIKGEEEVEDLIESRLIEISMNISDYIGFDEVGEDIKVGI